MSEKSNNYQSMKGRKVLITGGLGFIGSNLVHRYLELGAQVTVYDCLDSHAGGRLFNIDDVIDDVTLRVNDILNFEKLCEEVRNQELIINCAASTSHAHSMKEPWFDQDVNSKGMINLLEAIRRFNPQVRFLHLGTTTQLGPLQYQPADEKHPEFPTDIYSANKCVAEKYALIYTKAHQIDATVLRISNVFGPRASIHSPEFTFNNYFIGLALQDKAITVYGDGAQMRNVLFIDDVVNALVLIAQEQKSKGEVLLLAGDQHYSVLEIAQQTVEHIGSGKITNIPWPEERKKVDVGDAVISNKKIKSLIDWTIEDNLESGLTKTKKFYANCLDKYLSL
jgi:UDP-glucose 4-epimerase